MRRARAFTRARSSSVPSVLPAGEAGGALAVGGGGTEEGAAEQAALEPELDVALPGEADPAVTLDGVARHLHRALADVRLGERGGARGLLGEVVEGVRGVPDQRARRLDLERHVRELVLERLEVSDRDPELLARLRLLHRRRAEPRPRAERVRRQQHEAGVAHARRRARRLRQQLAGRALEDDRVEAARPVDALDGRERHALRAPLDEREAPAGEADHEQVRERRVGHVRLRAGEALADLERPLLGLPETARLAEGDRRERLARDQPRQPRLALLAAAGELDREPRERVAEEGAGRSAVAEHLRREREVGELEARPAPLLAEVEPAEAELDHPLPERGVVALALEDRAQVRRRALPGQEAPDRLLQQALLVGEVEVHRPALRCAHQSRGSPRPRSAITLRCTLALPPAIAMPSEYMYCVIQDRFAFGRYTISSCTVGSRSPSSPRISSASRATSLPMLVELSLLMSWRMPGSSPRESRVSCT